MAARGLKTAVCQSLQPERKPEALCELLLAYWSSACLAVQAHWKELHSLGFVSVRATESVFAIVSGAQARMGVWVLRVWVQRVKLVGPHHCQSASIQAEVAVVC
jgi:hypothetical protein